MAEEMREKLFRDIEMHRSTIRHIRTNINALAGISRLPTELLINIFELCAFPFLGGGYVYGIADDLICITHVCKHWRQIALNSSRLWTDIVLTLDTSHVREFLRRSKTQLLDVYIHENVDEYHDKKALELVFGQLPRIQYLYVGIDIATLLPRNVEIPHLRTLDLSNWETEDCLATMRAFQNAPSLQSVELPCFPGCWQGLRHWKGLRHLRVGHYGGTNDPPEPSIVDEAVSCLHLLTSLETFHLHCHFLSDRPGSQTARISVPLPSVTQIALYRNATDCAQLLSCLAFPSLAIADLAEIRPDGDSDDAFAAAIIPIARSIGTRLKDSRLPVFLTMKDVSGRIMLKATVLHDHSSTNVKDTSPRLSLPELQVEVLRARLLPHLPMDAVRVASVGCRTITQEEMPALGTILKTMCNIEELTVTSGRRNLVLSELFETVDSEHPPYPHLRVLKIESDYEERHKLFRAALLGPDAFGELERALRIWSRDGKKLRLLCLEGFYQLSAEHTTALAVYADDVVSYY